MKENGTMNWLEQIHNDSVVQIAIRVSDLIQQIFQPFLLTELKKPKDTAHARIYDRLLELCTPIACTGPSMRKNIGQEKLNLQKTLLA